SLSGLSRDYLSAQAALGYLTLGRIEAAAQTSRRIDDSVVRNDMLAQIAFIKGDSAALRHSLQYQGDRKSRPDLEGLWETTGLWDATLILQVRAGLMTEAERYVTMPHWNDDESHWIRGEITLAHGDVAAGIRELEEARKLSGDSLGTESLAAALINEGDVPRAIQVLEGKPDRFHEVIGGGTGAYWLRDRLELA